MNNNKKMFMYKMKRMLASALAAGIALSSASCAQSDKTKNEIEKITGNAKLDEWISNSENIGYGQNESIGTLDYDDGIEAFNEGITQIVDVPGQDFKLQIKYIPCLNDEYWYATNNNMLFIDFNTIGLNSDDEVYISNTHIVESCCKMEFDNFMKLSNYYCFNVFEYDDCESLQSSIGFPINDEKSHRIIFQPSFVHSYNRNVYGNMYDLDIDLVVSKSNDTQKVGVKNTICINSYPIYNDEDGKCYYSRYYTYNNGRKDISYIDDKEITEEEKESIEKRFELKLDD